MILIPEQVKALRDKITSLKKQKSALLNNNEDIKELDDKIIKCQTILGKGEILRTINYKKIDYGTKFIVDTSLQKYQEVNLVENTLFLNEKNYVDTNSSFGENVSGKRVGDKFSYLSPLENVVIEGKIVEILSRDKIGVHLIRERIKSLRINKKMERYIKELHAKNDLVTLRKLDEITTSQYSLLDEESDNLTKAYLRLSGDKYQPDEHYIYNSIHSVDSRLGLVRKKLQESVITKPKSSDIIEIGSKVGLTVFDKEEPIKICAELINHAVSTELDTDYIELISSLGLAIFGLKAGDEFSYYVAGGNIRKGIISKVNNLDNITIDEKSNGRVKKI